MGNYTNKVVLFICFSIILFSLVGCITTAPPLPVLNITPPSPDVPSEVVAFLGIWEGKWGGAQDTIIVVDKIDTQKAEVIISYGSLVQGIGFKPANQYRRITANVQPGPRLEFYEATEPHPEACDKCDYVCPCKAIFELDKRTNNLIATWEYVNHGMKVKAELMRRK